mmetsp:Transcript_55348/g.124368  ORF Transcript_55348/g.124368 Transcript_55348/m.124368 type:complete len:724 (-) Transcript_55348:81-2252(-)
MTASAVMESLHLQFDLETSSSRSQPRSIHSVERESSYKPLLSHRMSALMSDGSLKSPTERNHYAEALEAGHGGLPVFSSNSGQNLVRSLTSINPSKSSKHVVGQDASPENLLERDVKLQRRRVAKLESHLTELDKLWSSRRDELLHVAGVAKAELERLESDLWLLHNHGDGIDEEDVHGQALRFVDGGYFNLVCVGVIVLNCCTMVLQATDPAGSSWLWICDQLFLIWYISEVFLRALRHRVNYFCGRKAEVAWNWLDLIIVASGIADQWLLPLAFAESGIHGHSFGSLRALRLLRLMRMARILRAANRLWNSDLSWVEGHNFHMFIVIVIGLNALVFGLELDRPWEGWTWFENTFLIIYTLELIGRLKHHGKAFFCDQQERVWNILDLCIYIAGVADQWVKPAMWIIWEEVSGIPAGSHRWHMIHTNIDRKTQMLRVVRLLRILRLARLLRAIKPLHKLMVGVMEAMKSLYWVMVLTCITLYAFAILATTLVGHGLAFEDGETPEAARGMFTDIPNSMFLLFKVMNDDQSVMDPLIQSSTMRLVFVVFMVTANWLILATLTAVVSENMINAAKHQEEADDKHRRAVETQASHARLADIFTRLDQDGSGTVDEAEFREMLEDPVLRDEVCDSTGLQVEELYDLFDFLSVEAEDGTMSINYQDFIRKLHIEADVVHERSIFRIEKKLYAFDRRLEEMMHKLDGKPETELKRTFSKKRAVVVEAQ